MLLTEDSQEKLKKIRNSGCFCCITIKSDYMYVWDIYLTPAERTIKLPDGTLGSSPHEVKYRSGSYEDLNDAVNSIYKQVELIIEK